MKKSELVALLQAEIAAQGDGEVCEHAAKLLTPPTEEEQAIRGKRLAEVLRLRKDPEYKDRYQTSWGGKTAVGVFATVRRLVAESQ